jgi:hypothetical protein
MVIFQYIPQSNIFIMNCNYSKMIGPAQFFNVEKPRYRVPESEFCHELNIRHNNSFSLI